MTTLDELFNEFIEKRKAAGHPNKLGKHTAANYATCFRIIDELDAAEMHEAASWGVWMMWWRLQHDQREQLLYEDYREQVEELRKRIKEIEGATT